MIYPWSLQLDESTVELDAWYDVVGCQDGHVYGRAKLRADGMVEWNDLYALPIIGTQLRAAAGNIRFDLKSMTVCIRTHEVCYLAALECEEDKNRNSDCCKSCHIPGTFKKTALVCPKCGALIGGF